MRGSVGVCRATLRLPVQFPRCTTVQHATQTGPYRVASGARELQGNSRYAATASRKASRRSALVQLASRSSFRTADHHGGFPSRSSSAGCATQHATITFVARTSAVTAISPLTVPHVLLSCPGSCGCGSRARHLGHIAPDVTLRHIIGGESVWVSTGSPFSFIQGQLPGIYRQQ